MDFYKTTTGDRDLISDNEKKTLVSQNTETVIGQFKLYCAANPECRFRLYSTRNGIHAFLVSHQMYYRSEKAINCMISLDSDFYYIVYSYLRGFSIRLNRKNAAENEHLYKYICDVGSGYIDCHLEKLAQLHLNLVPVFSRDGFSSMRGA